MRRSNWILSHNDAKSAMENFSPMTKAKYGSLRAHVSIYISEETGSERGLLRARKTAQPTPITFG